MKKALSCMLLLNLVFLNNVGIFAVSQSTSKKTNCMIDFSHEKRFRTVEKFKELHKTDEQRTLGNPKIVMGAVVLIMLVGAWSYPHNYYVESELSIYVDYSDMSSELKEYLLEQMNKMKDTLEKKNICVEKGLLFPLTLLKILNLCDVFKSMRDKSIGNFIFNLDSSGSATHTINFYLSSEENTHLDQRYKSDSLFDHEFKKNWYASTFSTPVLGFYENIDNKFCNDFFRTNRFSEELLELLKKFTFKFDTKYYNNRLYFSSKNHESYNAFDLDRELNL